MIARLTLPPPPAAIAVLVAAFAFTGLANHDPWKAFDAIGIEIVHQMHVTGDWLVPRIAGSPWLEDPPLYHWVALLFAKLLGGVLEFHNAARVASGAFLLAAAWLLHRAGGALAPLVLVGCVGLMVHAHEAIPDLAALACICGALVVLVRAPRRPAVGGILLGAAIGGTFLSTGFSDAIALLAAAFLACGFSPLLRARVALPLLATAVPVAVALAASWPLALWLRSPELLDVWWQVSVRPWGDLGTNLRYFVGIGGWFAWPAWLLAAWALWSQRRRLDDPALLVPLAASVTLFCSIVAAGPAQDVNAITLLAPLSLLAAQGVALLRRGAANALDWFGVMNFAFFAGLVWLGWFAMMTGVPPRIANNFAKTAPGFEPAFDGLAVAAALLLAAAWTWVAFHTAPAAARGVTRWAAGVVLLWGSFAMLWMPWADHQKSYRSVAVELGRQLPPTRSCVAQRNLGVPQGAALSYHAGIRAQPFDPARPHACSLLLIQGSPREESDVPGPGWTLIAEAGRPGDRSERFRLYEMR